MTAEGRQQRRAICVCVFLVFLLSVLVIRLCYIHFVRGDRLSQQARAHYEYEEVIEAPRGRIFDRHGELLATSQTVYTMFVDGTHIKDPVLASVGLARKEDSTPRSIRAKYAREELQDLYFNYVVEELASEASRTPEALSKELKSSGRGEFIIADNIEEDYHRKLEIELAEKKLGGVYLRKSQRRTYPSRDSLSHVIGFVGGDQKGKEGVEKVFEREMSGQDGVRICQRDRRQREIIAFRQSQQEPVAGNDVYLTIDMALQSMVEQHLDQLVETYQPEKISTIWLKPSTGEVLALANRPHFDLETRRGVRRNSAVSDVYQPGSTFKLVAYGAAFDQGLITKQMLIDCHRGRYDKEGFSIKDAKAQGRISVEKALAESSNIGAYMVAKRLGEQRFYRYMERFGFGRKTGIALTAESSGLIYPVNQWSHSSLSSMSIGYEVQVTPLQMAAACNVVANKGVYRSPVLLSKIDSPDGTVSPTMVAKAKATQVISEQAANDLRSCMETAVKSGTGKRAAISGFRVAGKTGTARKHVEHIGYADGRYVVSFVGFFPADNPELLGIVVIDDPRTNNVSVTGGAIAAPVFKEIATGAIQILGISPERNALSGN